jgi:hypothetical protein
VLNSRSIVTVSSSGDSSASRAQVLPSSTLVQNCLPAIPSTELDRRHFSASLAELNCTQLSTGSTIHSAGLGSSLYSLGIVACVFVAMATCLPSRYLAINVSSGCIIPAFRRHVTICNTSEFKFSWCRIRCYFFLNRLFDHAMDY